MSNIKIGLHHKYYGYATAVYNTNLENVRYISVPFIPFRKLKYKSELLGNIKIFSPLPSVDIYHTYNNIVWNKKNWIVSFESFLPRFLDFLRDQKTMTWGYEKLASKHCRKILPISHAAKRLFYGMARFHNFDPIIFDSKTTIIYPAIQAATPKFTRNDNNINLIFIGNLFYQKGGRVVVDTFNELCQKYPHLQLMIISSMNRNTSLGYMTEDEHLNYLDKNILKNKKIYWLQNVPHQDVLNYYLPSADINLLPTFDDTFGFVIAEAMFAGLPTIATNVFAIPEMVKHGENGFLIDIPMNEFGMIEIFWENSLAKKKQWLLNLEEEIKPIFKNYLVQLIENKDLRVQFGKKSVEIALEKFDYRVRNEKLAQIYQEALN